MLGLLLIYFIGKYFYDLAQNNNKNAWLFAVLGIVVYYAGTFVAGILIALFYSLVLEGDIDNVNDMLLGIIALPFGLLTSWLFYRFLEKSWSTEKTSSSIDVLDQDLLN
jgi:hypothetical protein